MILYKTLSNIFIIRWCTYSLMLIPQGSKHVGVFNV
jgi:hypothetical protein